LYNRSISPVPAEVYRCQMRSRDADLRAWMHRPRAMVSATRSTGTAYGLLGACARMYLTAVTASSTRYVALYGSPRGTRLASRATAVQRSQCRLRKVVGALGRACVTMDTSLLSGSAFDDMLRLPVRAWRACRMRAAAAGERAVTSTSHYPDPRS